MASLMQQAAEAQPHQRRRRTLTRKSTDQQVVKAISDNLSDMTHEEIYVDEVDGQTAYDCLVERKRLNKEKPKDHPMGKNFYQEIRAKYKKSKTPQQLLRCKNANDTVHPDLVKAMNAFKGPQCSKMPMCGFIENAQTVNQRELVGILRFALSLKANASAEQMTCALACMGLMARLDMTTAFPEEYKIMKEWLDVQLVSVYNTAKASGQAVDKFIEARRNVLALLLPMKSVDAVVTATGSWNIVENHVHEIVKSSTLGHRLFGFAVVQVVSDHVKTIIKAKIDELFRRSGAIATPDLTTLQKQILMALDKIPNLESLPWKREVLMDYRGRAIKVKVACLQEEVALRIACGWKSVAAASGDLGAILFEDKMVDAATEASKGKISPDVIAPAQEARKHFNERYGGDGTVVGSSLVRELAKKDIEFIAVDPGFKIEVAFITSMAGQSGDELIQNKVLSILPAEGKVATMEAVIKQLDELRKSCLGRFVSHGSQGMLAAIGETIADMTQGRRPSLQGSSSFVSHVKLRLPFFCSHEQEDGKVISGRAAIDQKYKKIQEQDESSLTMDDLEPLRVFGMFLDEEQDKKVQALTTAVLQKLSKEIGKTQSSSSKPASAKHGPAEFGTSWLSPPQKKAKSEVNAVMGMFD